MNPLNLVATETASNVQPVTQDAAPTEGSDGLFSKLLDSELADAPPEVELALALLSSGAGLAGQAPEARPHGEAVAIPANLLSPPVEIEEMEVAPQLPFTGDNAAPIDGEVAPLLSPVAVNGEVLVAPDDGKVEPVEQLADGKSLPSGPLPPALAPAVETLKTQEVTGRPEATPVAPVIQAQTKLNREILVQSAPVTDPQRGAGFEAGAKPELPLATQVVTPAPESMLRTVVQARPQAEVKEIAAAAKPASVNGPEHALFGSSGGARIENPLGEGMRPASAPVFQGEIREQVMNPGWDRAMANRIAWLANNNIQQAQLRLSPPNLGPLEVQIMVNRDEASVIFGAQHLPVREAVEAAVPRLRELFAESGINLANVDVSEHALGQSRGGGDETPHADGLLVAEEEGVDITGLTEHEHTEEHAIRNGLVDAYA